MEEIEVKFLDIRKDALGQKLITIGAHKVFEKVYRRRIFDYPDLRLNNKGAWIRLRDEGEKITLTYKERLGITANDGTVNDAGMEEVELIVSDFDATAEFFRKIGFIEKFYQENRRTRYMLGETEFDIDEWPGLPPYLEIEAPSWDHIEKAIVLLGLNPDAKKIMSTGQIYKMHDINELEYCEMTFARMVKKHAQ